MKPIKDSWLKALTPIFLAYIGTFLTIIMANTDKNPDNDYDLTIWIISLIGISLIIIFAILYQNRNNVDFFINTIRELNNTVDESNKKLSYKIDELERQQKKMLSSQHVTMRTILIYNAETYINRDYITPEELKSWEEMYLEYSKLGMNGFVETFKNQIEKLKIKIK